MSRVDLARELAVTPGAITNMLKGDTKSSRLVEKTCLLLHIPPPEFEGEHEEMLVQVVRFLNEHDPHFVQRLLGQAQKRAAELSSKERSSSKKR